MVQRSKFVRGSMVCDGGEGAVCVVHGGQWVGLHTIPVGMASSSELDSKMKLLVIPTSIPSSADDNGRQEMKRYEVGSKCTCAVGSCLRCMAWPWHLQVAHLSAVAP